MIEWKDGLEYGAKLITPAIALWIFAERKVKTWKTEVDEARAARAKEEKERADLLLASQTEANTERKQISESVATLVKSMAEVKTQVEGLAKENTNNDGSTARDRTDLMYFEVKALGSLMGATAPIAMWWGMANKDGSVTPIRVSDQFVKLTGMSHEQTRNGGWLNFVHVEDQLRVSEIADVAIRRGQVFQADYRLVNIVTEAETRVRHFGTPIRNPVTDKIVGWTGEIYELTDPSIHAHRRASDAPERHAA